MRAALLSLALLARGARGCTYDQTLGTQCTAAAPLAATAANAEDAPGGVVNLGGTGLASVFAVLSDWGAPPLSNAAQVAASKGMNSVCAANACKAVLTAGNNFLPAGLPAAADAAATAARVAASWSGVYGLGPALEVPWYLTGGYADWLGNITAERDLSVASTTTGSLTWHYPQLWQSLSFVVPPGYGTLQVLMLDTVTLLGEMTPGITAVGSAAPVAAAGAAAAQEAALLSQQQMIAAQQAAQAEANVQQQAELQAAAAAQQAAAQAAHEEQQKEHAAMLAATGAAPAAPAPAPAAATSAVTTAAAATPAATDAAVAAPAVAALAASTAAATPAATGAATAAARPAMTDAAVEAFAASPAAAATPAAPAAVPAIAVPAAVTAARLAAKKAAAPAVVAAAVTAPVVAAPVVTTPVVAAAVPVATVAAVAVAATPPPAPITIVSQNLLSDTAAAPSALPATAAVAATPAVATATPAATATVVTATPVAAAPTALPETLALATPAVTPVRRAAARKLADFNTFTDPPLQSQAQWTWLQSELESSTADWLIVIGNDPVWSAGANGPTPGLAGRLLPMLETAGVSLYIGGRDPLAQHFAPSSIAPNVDVITVGNGAAGNATQAALLPNRAQCPGALEFVYGAGAGFATLSFALPPTGSTAQLTVSFFNEVGTSLYSFTKNATRAGKAAPPPEEGVHGSHSGLLMLLALAAVIAGGAGFWIKMSYDPVEPDPPPRQRAPPRGFGSGLAGGEEQPLLPKRGQVKGARFNTFSL